MKRLAERHDKGKAYVLKWMNDYYNTKERAKDVISKYENTEDIVFDKLTKQYKNDQSTLAVDIMTILMGGPKKIF